MMLIGIVTKNGTLIVDFVNPRMDAGLIFSGALTFFVVPAVCGLLSRGAGNKQDQVPDDAAKSPVLDGSHQAS
ncbi:MAG: hypothetical protein WEB53_13315 [Akkermansiaceae bacterium]